MKLTATWPFGAPRASQERSIYLISSSSLELPSGPIDLSTIFSAKCCDFDGHRSLIQVNRSRAYLVWVREVFETSFWNIDDAVKHVEGLFDISKRPATTAFLCRVQGFNDEKLHKERIHLVTLLDLTAQGSNSVAISWRERNALEDRRVDQENSGKTHSSWLGRHLSVLVLMFVLVSIGLILVTSLAFTHQKASKDDLWMTWQIPEGSKGCQNQLQYTWPHPNFTSWATQKGYTEDDFFLRLDDQTLIPTKYVGEDEKRYNEWYTKRYPWFDEIRSSKAYLNESFWRDAVNHQLPIDHEFHVAHCIKTLKGYWKGRETNTHVCPREFVHDHLQHCFNVLENYAIPDFRHDAEHDGNINGSSIVWIVNACF